MSQTNEVSDLRVAGKRLEIHVIGGSKGESIVVRLPNDAKGRARWGVVDCYTASLADPQTNPTLSFLQSSGVNATELEFLCLTHPHDDHYRGMSHLLEHLKVHRFWQFNVPQNLITSFINIANKTARFEDERSSAKELKYILQLVEAKRIQIDYLMANQYLYPMPEKSDSMLSIRALSPSGRHIAAYHRAIIKWSHKRLRSKSPLLRANAISGSLLITYGQTRLILGGDVESGNWRHTRTRFSPDWLASQAVKVSHHGSSNGYCKYLWQEFSPAQDSYAIITPYQQQDLPSKEAVEHIYEHTKSIITTCRPAIPLAQWKVSPRDRTRHWNADPYCFTPDRPQETQMVGRMAFYGFEEIANSDIGICSLMFDAHGNCSSPTFDGTAERL